MEARMPEQNAIDRIKQLEHERDKLFDTAKKEALARVETAVAELNSLGFSYMLEDRTSRAPRKARAKRKSTHQMKNRPCPICKFKTSPPHDARKHRFTQGKKKRPYTSKELADLGLKKV